MVIKKNLPLRVAILTNIIPRYRTPILLSLAKDPRFQIKFFVSLPPDLSDPLAVSTLDLQQTKTFNFRWRTQTQSVGVVQKERLPIPLGLFLDLIRFRPDIIVSGDLGIRSLVAFLMAKLLKVPLLVWTEETLEHDANVSRFQKRLRAFLIPRIDGFLAWGKSACNYLAARGVEETCITYCTQAVDNTEWSARAASCDPIALKKELGTKGRVCLAVGRLLPRKGFKEMISAYGALPVDVRNRHSLVLVGDGPEKKNLQEQAKKLKIENFFMPGPKSPQELAVYYKAADFMVLPSLTDVWGLVVNEAMACDTPVISSIHAGVTEELIVDTGIGEKFDPNNQEQFTSVLEKWLESPPKIEQGKALQAVERLNFNVSISNISKRLQSYIASDPIS